MENKNGNSTVQQMDQFKGLLGKAYYLMDRLDEKAIALAVYERVREKAVYRITFKTKRGSVEITGLSVDGAEELYRLCRFRGLVPLLEVKEIRDTQANGLFITTIIWKVLEPTLPPTTWELITRGSASISEELFERKALGKAQRNAQLKVIPLVVREAMKAVLGQKLGVKELIWDEEESNPFEIKNGEGYSPGQSKDLGSKFPADPVQKNLLEMKNPPSPQDIKPSVKRLLTKVIQINGKKIRTAGIEAEQLVSLWEAVEKTGKEKVSRELKGFGVEKSVYLLKNEAEEILVRLKGISSTSMGTKM